MRLSSISGQKQIYCDLDGVLADFKTKAILLTGISPDDISKKDEFWMALRNHGKRNEKIWEVLELLPDAMELWNYIKLFDPIICTASGGFPNAEEEKRAWVSKHLGDIKVIVVVHSKDKSQFADQNSILIDDQMKSIEPWQKRGGIGILHVSAAESINKLKQIL